MIRINPDFYRPAEVDSLLGDSTYAQEKLGWKLNSSLEDLVEEMVAYDISKAV